MKTRVQTQTRKAKYVKAVKSQTQAKEFLTARQQDLNRIAAALDRAVSMVLGLRFRAASLSYKCNNDPVTAADLMLNQLLYRILPRENEGWLSEESKDDLSRLQKRRVWVVDPLDGTKEFIQGIPEWCISIGLVEDGQAVAGGVANPSTGEVYLGSLETGLSVWRKRAELDRRYGPDALVLASRTEVNKGKWTRFENRGFRVRPMGSIAYRLARVAAGFADATWTLDPRHEWDVAAGAALVKAAQGVVRCLDGSPLIFNRPQPQFNSLVACSSIDRGLLEFVVNNVGRD
jgi:myo-inositol-1(or 4)-monophosphatase